MIRSALGQRPEFKSTTQPIVLLKKLCECTPFSSMKAVGIKAAIRDQIFLRIVEQLSPKDNPPDASTRPPRVALDALPDSETHHFNGTLQGPPAEDSERLQENEHGPARVLPTADEKAHLHPSGTGCGSQGVINDWPVATREDRTEDYGRGRGVSCN